LATAQARRRAGEKDRAALSRHHDFCRLAPNQEAGERRHLPHLPVHALGRLADREAHIAAHVEHADLDRADLALDRLYELRDLLLAARVAAEGVRLAAFGLDGLHQRRQLVRGAPRHASRETFAREAPRDRAAGRLARSDDQRGLCLRHGYLSLEYAVGARILLLMFATMAPFFSDSARALSQSASAMKLAHTRSRSARSFHSSR